MDLTRRCWPLRPPTGIGYRLDPKARPGALPVDLKPCLDGRPHCFSSTKATTLSGGSTKVGDGTLGSCPNPTPSPDPALAPTLARAFTLTTKVGDDWLLPSWTYSGKTQLQVVVVSAKFLHGTYSLQASTAIGVQARDRNQRGCWRMSSQYVPTTICAHNMCRPWMKSRLA